MTLFDKPNKNKAGDKSYHGLGVVLPIVIFVIQHIGKLHHLDCPCIPVGEFLIESLGKHLDRETAAQVLNADHPASGVEVFVGGIIGDTLAKVVRITVRVGVGMGDVGRTFLVLKSDLDERETIVTIIVLRDKENQCPFTELVGKHTKRLFGETYSGIVD